MHFPCAGATQGEGYASKDLVLVVGHVHKTCLLKNRLISYYLIFNNA
jgi:hypothetical protein